MRLVLTLMLALTASLTAGESWTLPRAWAGKKLGSVEGNPLVDAGGPRWRIDQIYPDKPAELANWKPMVWAEVQKRLMWYNAAGSQGGHPQVRVEKGQALIGVYSKAVNLDWSKVPAVVFIAPRDGGYRMVAQTQARHWESNGLVEVRFYRLDRAGGTVEEAGSDVCGTDAPRRSQSRVVRLAKGDELAASFWIGGNHSGATITASIGATTAKAD